MVVGVVAVWTAGTRPLWRIARPTVSPSKMPQKNLPRTNPKGAGTGSYARGRQGRRCRIVVGRCELGRVVACGIVLRQA